MYEVTRKEFEQLVDEGIALIPERFLALIDNVAIVVEDEPTEEQKQKVKLAKDSVLFGLYEGIPKLKRIGNYSMMVPDRITIFQRSIQQAARDKEHLKDIVRETVWHEIAHHFGSDEQRVRDAEIRRRHSRTS